MKFRLLLFSVTLLFLASCREYKKLLKSSDLDKKYSEAVKFYEKGDCIRSLQLFDELLQVYKGTPKYESIYFYYAYSHYCVGDYIMAAYHFKTFNRSYPTSKHAEECAFMAAQCYFFESPRYTLDQTDTHSAIKELQSFINRYPNSTKLDSCNTLIEKLRTKLEKKDMEISLQYYHMEDYKAAIASFNNLLKEYPDTRFREKVNYYIIKATYEQALRSIDEKKVDRLAEVIDLSNKFLTAYRDSGEFRTEVDIMSISARSLKERFSWEIPFANYENRKYAAAIDGFKSYLQMYSQGDKAAKAKEYISDCYFLLIQQSWLNIDKSYGANPVVNAYKAYLKNAGKFTSLVDPKYSEELQMIREKVGYFAMDRAMTQLQESFRLHDLNSLVYYKLVEEFYLEHEKQVLNEISKKRLADHWAEVKKGKEAVDKEIGFWFFEAKDHERSRELLVRYFPVTEGLSHSSRAFYTFMTSLFHATEGISVLRPEIRNTYYDSLYKLDKSYTHLLSAKYKRRLKDLMHEVEESKEELPGDQVEQLFLNGQYDLVNSVGKDWLSKSPEAEENSRIRYYMIRTGYLTSRYGYPSLKMLHAVQSGIKSANELLPGMKGKYKRKARKMLRKMNKKASFIQASIKA